MDRWVSIRNQSAGGIELVRARWCESGLCRMRGLTFRRSLAQNEGLLLVGKRDDRTEASIHMVAVFFSLGVVWIDSEGNVVDCKIARPMGFYFPLAGAKYVLESRPELLKAVSIGDVLEFVDET